LTEGYCNFQHRSTRLANKEPIVSEIETKANV
jgi:hypothetical protein